MASMAAEAPDVCYSWWILSALVTIDRAHWIDMEKLGRGSVPDLGVYMYMCTDNI
jgi:hypothetical protein